MNEPVLIFCRQWAVTSALTSLLASAFTIPVIPVYGEEQLVHMLRKYCYSPVVLGISPHEYIVPLYMLGPLLVRRQVLFVARHFWWTDYELPAFAGITEFRFCTLDTLADPHSRRAELKWFNQHKLFPSGCTVRGFDNPVTVRTVMKSEYIIERANFWLYKRMAATGLNGLEIIVLLLLAESRQIRLSSRLVSLYKIKGFYKLRMKGRVMNLYRGVIVRQELQMLFPPELPVWSMLMREG
ncbi:hypothetical protein LJO70_004571 [Salmonella enterica]|nr:hypothetical protein [Salmonella enterica]